MILATLTFSSPDWLGYAVGAVGLALLVLWWSYSARATGRLGWGCAVLKMLGLAALAFCLLEPLWSGQRARPGANYFAILADNSQGLQVQDQNAKRSRGETLKAQLVEAGADWLETLEDQFAIRRFYFDARLHSTRDFGELRFDGRASALRRALRSLKDRFAGRPLAGVLLFTDGNATDWRGPLPGASELPPVYPVVVGRRGQIRDAALARVNVSQTAFEDAPVSIQADVAAAGLRGESLVARLLDGAGHEVETQTQRVRQSAETLAFRFRVRPEQPGLTFYQLRVSTPADMAAAGAANPSPGTNRNVKPKPNRDRTREATLLNNSRILAVDRRSGPYRILYVAGRPNWEYKFLNRALQVDDQIQLVALIRVALREPKFDFRGRAGETGNPLFRGFGNQSREEVERYDEPVLVRLNTRDKLELRGGFPRTPEELYAYHAVIVDDVEAAFFKPDQANLLQKFVSERGGGFLMLGGMESFQQGKYSRTPVGDMLPVYLDRRAVATPEGPVRLDLSREGWLQSWMRLRDNEADERARLENMAAFRVLNRVREIKPAASILATAKDAQGKTHPALVTQRFGRGRTAALLVGDVWRWGMREAAARQDMEKAWRQWVRWLVADVPNRVELAVEPSAQGPEGAVALTVRVRDKEFQPLDEAAVTLEVQRVLAPGTQTSTNTVRLRAEPSLEEAGRFTATFVPRKTGGYRATAYVTNWVGAEMGRAVAGWSTDLQAEEFRSLQPNVALLETIAHRTGGQVVAADKLGSFVRELPRRQAPVMEAYTSPAWHTPMLFAFALVCLLGEWGLRRWKGLP